MGNTHKRFLPCLTKVLNMNEYSSCFTMAWIFWAFLSSGGGGFFILILNVSFYPPPLVGNPNQNSFIWHCELWTWVGSSRCNVHTLIFQFPSICVANISGNQKDTLFQMCRELEEDEGIWLNGRIFHLYLDFLEIKEDFNFPYPKPPLRGPKLVEFRSL